MNLEIIQLQQELSTVIGKMEKTRKMLRVCRALCYGVTLLCVAFILVFPSLWGEYMVAFTAVTAAVFMFGTVGLALAGRHFTGLEKRSVKRILHRMFPDAKCNIQTFEVYPSLINASFFFGDFDYALSLGTIAFRYNGQKLEIKDMLINQDIYNGLELWRMKYGHVFIMLKDVFGGVFTHRIENTPSSFRGLFAHTRIVRNIHCSITILPERLGERKNYLSKTYRSVVHVRDNELIEFEGTEFERYFTVYSTNEVVARIIISPVMMARMVELKKKYGRDVMLSFVGDLFFFAVYMPEGFITTGNSREHSVKELADLYDNVAAVRGILHDLNLGAVPPKAAQGGQW